MTLRPVKVLLRCGAFQIARGRAGEARPRRFPSLGAGPADRRRAAALRMRCASSSRNRSTGLWSRYGVGSRTSSTLSGTSGAVRGLGSSVSVSARQTASAYRDFRKAFDSSDDGCGLDRRRRPETGPVGDVVRQHLAARSASAIAAIQSAHIRFSPTYATTMSAVVAAAGAAGTRPGSAAGPPRRPGQRGDRALRDDRREPFERGQQRVGDARSRRRRWPGSPRTRSRGGRGSPPRPSRPSSPPGSARPRRARWGSPSNFSRASARPASTFSFSPSSIRIGTGSIRMRRLAVAVLRPAGDGGGAVERLVAEGEAVDEDVRQLDVQMSAMSDSPVRLSMRT